MKKSLLAIAFAMVAMVSSAQIYVGGSLGLDFGSSGVANNNENYVDNKTMISIAPEVGYILNEDLSFGAALEFGTTSRNYGNTKSASCSWKVAPYARYTFFNSGIFSCFVDGVISLSGDMNFSDAVNARSTFGIFAKPGIALNISENIRLISHVGQIGWSIDWNAASYTNNLKLDVDASIAKVGLYYTF